MIIKTDYRRSDVTEIVTTIGFKTEEPSLGDIFIEIEEDLPMPPLDGPDEEDEWEEVLKELSEDESII